MSESTAAKEKSASAPEPFDPKPLLVVVAALAISLTVFFLAPKEEFGPGLVPDENPIAAATSASEPKESPEVVLETTMGKIRVRLFADKAPKTAENFLDLVRRHFYDGIVFHRVIKDFMIQTGDPGGDGTGGRERRGLPPKTLEDEFHPDLRHDKPGILSMANAGPNTGDAQFFITTRATPHLDDRHAVFGEVVDGMDVVRAIESVPTGPMDRPIDPPRILRATVAQDSGATK